MDLLDKDFYISISDPTEDYSNINRILRESSLVRDKYIVKQIQKYWKEGKDIFIVYGASHAVMQEAAIRYIVAGK